MAGNVAFLAPTLKSGLFGLGCVNLDFLLKYMFLHFGLIFCAHKQLHLTHSYYKFTKKNRIIFYNFCILFFSDFF